MEEIKIENHNLAIKIKLTGAELCSLIDKRDGIEHMWQADPKFWPRHAPILFPTIGESKDGQIHIDGVSYPMGRHGFARFESFEVSEHRSDAVILKLVSNDRMKEHYPFDFQIQVGYVLEDNCLTNSFLLRNTGKKVIGFQLGGHPAFAVPFKKEESYSDYEIRFDRDLTIGRHLLTKQGLYSGEVRTFLINSPAFPLSNELFNEDALVFKDIPSRSVWIQHKDGGKRLQVDYGQFPHLGIWSVPGADYVCIEPWIGCADNADQPADFWMKDRLIRLGPQNEFRTAFSISLINT